MDLRPEASLKRMPVPFNWMGIFSFILLGIALGAFLVLQAQQRVEFSDVISPVVGLLVSVSLFVAARQSAAQSKGRAIAWGTIALAMLFYTIGDITWAIFELVLKQSPFPSLADGFYLAYYPAFLVGVILLIRKPANTGELVNNALDLAIMLVAAILGFWNFLIGPLIQFNVTAPLLEKLILAAYPVGDLVLLGALLLIIYNYSNEQPALPVLFLFGGMFITIFVDCVYGYQSLLGTYFSGSLLDLGWIAGNLLIGLAGASQWAELRNANVFARFQTRNAFEVRLRWIKTYLPYIWLLGAFFLLIRAALTPLPMTLLSVALSVGVVLGLVLIRQLIMLSENHKLNLQLKSQATRLESTNHDLNLEIAERLRMQEKMAFDVLHDHMTGLANRLLFLDRLGQSLERSKRHPDPSFAVLFMDLDQFKVVNDSLGHSCGDQLLIFVANRLKEALRSSDTIARFGGDEFAILLNDLDDEVSIRRLVERIQSELGRPFILKERVVYISASIGIATDLIKYDRPEDMLRDADLAMYRAKALGKARSEIFREELRDQAFSRMQLEDELRRGLQEHEFQLYYQPIASLESDRIVGLEALLRWSHPTKGLLLPAEFLPVAEETGLIIQIGNWVLSQACLQLKEWQTQHPYLENVTVNVNISDKEFSQTDLVENVARALSASGLKGTSLRLEITERVLVGNFPTANEIIAALHKMGVQVQIDDFGTGYSALSYLQEFPINAIKIDKSFINKIGRNGDGKGLGLVRAIVSMGLELGMETIAEGIETGEQLDELKGLLCGFGQGFLLYKPLDAASAEEVLISLDT